jgi:uncharacterized protein
VIRTAITLGALLAVLAGCLSLGPRPDPPRFYVLEAEANSPETGRPAVPVFGIGPVQMPEYLDRLEIIRRAGATRLEVAAVDRWAAPLDVLFTRTLAEDLRAAVPAREVLEWPWPVGAAPAWSVSVEVRRFEGHPDGNAVLEARWSLRNGDVLAHRGVTRARERIATSEVAATVEALSKAIGVLASDIAAAVEANREERPAALPVD